MNKCVTLQLIVQRDIKWRSSQLYLFFNISATIILSKITCVWAHICHGNRFFVSSYTHYKPYHRCFTVTFMKFFRIGVLKNTSGCVLFDMKWLCVLDLKHFNPQFWSNLFLNEISDYHRLRHNIEHWWCLSASAPKSSYLKIYVSISIYPLFH